MSSKSNLGLIDLEKPYSCEFCHKKFVKEITLTSHTCESRRRHQSQNQPEVKRALYAFQEFHKSLNPRSKTVKTFQEFTTSGLYPCFVKFGAWSLENQIQEYPHLVKWLIEESVKPQDWCDLNRYHMYLAHLLLSESSEQALKRSLSTMESWSRDTDNPLSGFFQLCNTNVIVNWVQSGKISGWMLYNAPSAVKFMERCSMEQLNLIQQSAPVVKWRIKFGRDQQAADVVRECLREAGL